MAECISKLTIGQRKCARVYAAHFHFLLPHLVFIPILLSTINYSYFVDEEAQRS